MVEVFILLELNEDREGDVIFGVLPTFFFPIFQFWSFLSPSAFRAFVDQGEED